MDARHVRRVAVLAGLEHAVAAGGARHGLECRARGQRDKSSQRINCLPNTSMMSLRPGFFTARGPRGFLVERHGERLVGDRARPNRRARLIAVGLDDEHDRLACLAAAARGRARCRSPSPRRARCCARARPTDLERRRTGLRRPGRNRRGRRRGRVHDDLCRRRLDRLRLLRLLVVLASDERDHADADHEQRGEHRDRDPRARPPLGASTNAVGAADTATGWLRTAIGPLSSDGDMPAARSSAATAVRSSRAAPRDPSAAATARRRRCRRAASGARARRLRLVGHCCIRIDM